MFTLQQGTKQQKFSSLCEWDWVIESLEHTDGDVYSDEDISGAVHVLIEHVLPVDHGVQQNAVMMAV